MDLMGKRVVVVGLGKSGHAATVFCAGEGASVVVSDMRPLAELGAQLDPLIKQGARVTLRPGPQTPEVFAGADLVVVSPGVPQLGVLDEVAARGVEVIGELELASRFTAVPILAVGGTNGKSTTTTLLAELLSAAGLRTFAGGNLGTPLCEALDAEGAPPRFDALVVEVSSFQLERVSQFKPKISVLLNASEDHLDRYPNFEAYVSAKGNSFLRQAPRDVAVIPYGDEAIEQQAKRGMARRVTFDSAAAVAGRCHSSVGEGAERGAESGTGRDDSADRGSEGGGGGGSTSQADYSVVLAPKLGVLERASGELFSLQDADLHGAHNASNAAAAIAAARAFGVGADAIRAGLARFRGLPHRMQLVGALGGVTFYDDSKATNVGSAVTALLGLSEPRAVLIAGGRDKQGSYEPLIAALERKGRALVVMGEASELIAYAAGNRVPLHRAADLPTAVRLAHSLAQAGDAVLLSPACSSFDMFQSYHERGVRFAEAVAALGHPSTPED